MLYDTMNEIRDDICAGQCTTYITYGNIVKCNAGYLGMEYIQCEYHDGYACDMNGENAVDIRHTKYGINGSNYGHSI